MQTATDTPSTKRYRSIVYGAVAGGFLALLLTALFAGITAIGATAAVILDAATSRARPQFVVTNGAMYLLVVVISIIGGSIVSAVTYAFNRQEDVDAEMFPLRWLIPAGAATAVVFAYIVLRAGLGAFGDITAGVVTVSVFRMVMITLVAGAVAGGATAATVDALASPTFLSIEGEAVPASSRSFMREMVRAVSGPMVGTLIAGAFAVGLAQILLAVEGMGAVAIFSVVGALVLGGATLLALRPWENRGGSGGAST